MYTQCPNCTTVFRVTAEVLRSAGGQVRCGVCAHGFNALENLSEEPLRAPRPESAPAQRPVEPVAPAPPAAEGASLEFHGDAADLDRLFVVQEAAPAEFDAATVAARLATADGDLERTDEYPIIVLDEQDGPDEPVAEEIVLESAPQAAQPSPDPPPGAYTAPRILIPEEMRQRLAQEASARATAVTDFGPLEAEAGSPRWPWAAAAAALLVILAGQVVHSERLSLAQRPGIGPLLAQAYGFLGRPLGAPTDLAAYELRQWGAASDPGQQGRLLLRASIVNRAQFAQPFPLLRLALQDRYGATLGVRDIEPGDYLPGQTASKLLGPGERADAEIRIVDPGQEAVGFEMDVCLPAEGGVRCASQITTAAQ